MGLAKYVEFLLKRRIVPEKNAKFLVKRVRQFLEQPVDPAFLLDERIESFFGGIADLVMWFKSVSARLTGNARLRSGEIFSPW